jgi:hypothetical protein
LLCIVDNIEYKEMFPVARILRKATRADIIKLVKKFSNADDTEVDQDKLLPYIQPYSEGAFEMQKVKSETIANRRSCEAAKRAMDFNLRSEVFKARLKAGCF